MNSLLLSALLAVSALSSSASSPSPAWSCCAYGGSGAVTLSGTATADVSGSGPELVAAYVAADPSPGSGLSAVLLGGEGDADSSLAGWMLEPLNATAQRFTVWLRSNATGGELECHRSDGPYLAGTTFSLCPGAAGSLFPSFLGDLMLGSVPGALFGQAPPALSTAAFTSAAGGCAPLWISSPVTPLGAGLGAFTIAVTQGSAASPPQGMRAPPAACVFGAERV
jgi:hypothetical protein